MFDIINKFKKSSVTVKATVVFGITSFAISGINYLTTPIFTRLLSTSEYGVVSVYNSWISIIQIIMSLTLIFPGILHVGLFEYAEKRYRYLSCLQGIVTVISILTIVGYCIFQEQIDEAIRIPNSLIFLMLIMCLFHPSMVFWTAKQRFEYKYKASFLVTIGTAFFAQVSAISMVLIYRDTGVNLGVVRLWGAGIVNLVVSIIIYLYIFFKGKCFYERNIWKETLIIAIPLIPHYLSSVILSSMDKIMIGGMAGDDKAGIYGLVATLSSIGVLFWRALRSTFGPYINAKIAERDFKHIQKTIKPLWEITGIFCVIGALLSPEAISVLATKTYLEGIYAVPPIVASIYCHALYDSFSAVAFFHKKTWMIMIASLVSALVNVVLNYYGIMTFGFVAAGYTTLIANIVLVIMHYINSYKIEHEQVYNFKYTFTTLTIVIVSCLMSSFLLSFNSIVRYFVVLLLLVLVFSKRKTVINSISDMKV